MGTRISDMPAASPLNGAEKVEVTQAGVTRSASVQQFSEFINPLLGGYQQTGAGTVLRAPIDKMRESVSIADFGAVGDGITNDTDAVTAAEASLFDSIDLIGRTVLTTLSSSAITKNYFNGKLLTLSTSGQQHERKLVAPTTSLEVVETSTKTPVLDWSGKNVLWLGTSIPQIGVGVNGYPELFGRALDCTVENMAWASSHAQYNVNGDPNTQGTVLALSMTEDDRLAGLALYGGSSAYSDTFNPITLASRMTADYRIKAPFAATPFDVVVLDHNHNDRPSGDGELNPIYADITAITKGATTAVTLVSAAGIVIGNSVALRVVGIPFLDYAAARVQNVVGNVVTLNIDSSGYAGAFVSGSATKLDRNTIYGAWDFLIHYIKWQGLINGKDPHIVLCSSGSEYTGSSFDNAIYSNARSVRRIADKWGLAFFDIADAMRVRLRDQLLFFPDTIHPTTLESRQAIANHWIAWASGGQTTVVPASATLPRGGVAAFDDQREALYSRFTGGFSTPKYVPGPYVNVVTDAFASMAGWTAEGTAPTLPAAPWGAGNAVLCHSTSGTPLSCLRKDALVTDKLFELEFDLYLPIVSGLTATSTPKTVEISRMNVTGATYYSLQLIVTPTLTALALQYFESAGINLITIPISTPFILAANTKYRIKLEFVKGEVAYKGAPLLYVDGVQVSDFAETTDTTWGTINKMYLGVISSNTGATLDLYFGNVQINKATVSDYSLRYTGTFTSADAKTVTVVNGIIVSAV